MNYLSHRHTFGTKGDERYINVSSCPNQILNFSTSVQFDDALQYVYIKEDLPAPVGGVITLVDNKTYLFMFSIDLMGNRIQCANNSIIKGTSSETSNIKSTGLTPGVALFTSTKTIIFQNITIEDVDTVFDLNGSDSSQVVDWDKFNIENSPNIGIIQNYGNFILTNSAFLNCAGLCFDGEIATIGIDNCLFTNFQNLVSIKISDTSVITRRFKLVESSMVTTGTGSSIEFSTSATVGHQGYVLTSINFSGGTSSAHLIGVQSNDVKSLFFKNLGIKNSESNGTLYVNVPSVTALVLNTWVKIAGATLPSGINQKFDSTDNRLIYTGSLSQIMRCSYNASVSGGNGDDIEFGVSKNGTSPSPETVGTQSIDSGGKINNIGITFYIELEENDHIELWARNITQSRNITATNINLSVGGQF